ncbi:HAD family hydrolase [Muricauda sp. 2012CJ35-5]|uniref:HAD family hydrolase n=1 Tax=Flagellimonas spongiicola TaxID=2942208 RepID=A0ABT0PSB6_9FLAO|nr:HAD family hydrolase [Allomuricauda spongiicola]MCL6274280.1 HAD family hydrolase [Allomuricauda spongiicola]
MANSLILDLDNTLYGYDIPHQLAYNKVMDSIVSMFGIQLDKAKGDFEFARMKTHYELPAKAASHNRLLYFQKMLELNGISSLQHAMHFYNIYWDTFLEQITLFDGVLDYLENHRLQGGKSCILTDLTAHIQYRKIEKLGLSNYVDYLVTSEEVGIEKPHPYMFTRALQKLECNTMEALMIGDSWSKDILGANAMGIDSIWINNDRQSRIEKPGIRMVYNFKEI